jgi:predicted nucleic acid-binding protein
VSALIVDTSSWISYFAGRGRPELIDEALQEGRVHLPLVVAGELCSGTLTRSDLDALEDFLRDLPMAGMELEHWCRVGRLRARVRQEGLTLSTPDAHVAQCTFELEGALLTEDAVFSKITDLRLA